MQGIQMFADHLSRARTKDFELSNEMTEIHVTATSSYNQYSATRLVQHVLCSHRTRSRC